MPNRLFSGLHPHARKVSVTFMLCALLIVLLAPVGPVEAERTSALSSKIDKELAKKLVLADSDKTFDVVLKVKARTVSGRSIRSVAQLKSSTVASQSRVLSAIKKAKVEGHVKEYTRFWIANAILVRADADTIRGLASRPDVKQVIPNFKVEPIKSVPSKDQVPGGGFRQMAVTNEWNLGQIGATDVWSDYSVTGDGTVVAVLDTGIDGTHPDLAGKIDRFVRIDFRGNATEVTPRDWYGHGTHVAGTIAGGDAGGTAIGVAPGAHLMGVQVFTGYDGTFAQMLGGMQWAADPDGNPLTDDQPDAANMSFGIYGNYPQFIEPIDNLRAAGVLPAVSIGNAGLGISGTPGNVPYAVGVGATDSDDLVAYFSSGEDTNWYDTQYAGVWRKPDISAPGVEVNSSVPAGGYDSWDGTSMASPHVAGAAALVKSSRPALTADQIDTILQSSAVDLGDRGKDTRYGNGRLDVRAAAELAQAFAVISGTVTAGGKAGPALIEILAEPGGTVDALAYSGGDGKYRVAVPPGTYKVRVSKYGFNPATSSALGPLADGGTATFSPTLTAATKYTLSGRVKDVTSGQLLNGTVKMISPVAASVKTNAGQYAFSVPSGQYVLRVSSAGYTRKDVTVDVAGANKSQDILMSKVKPTLLVVDIGALDYADYFKNALAASAVQYDTHLIDIEDPEVTFADAELLAPYKRVIWAAGDDVSTGTLVWRDEEDEPLPPSLVSYLEGGGKLFLSGQDIAYYVSFESQIKRAMGIMDHDSAYSFMRYINARYIKDQANNLSLSGRPKGIFQGAFLDLLTTSGQDGANNQYWPDVLVPTASTTVPELNYTKDATGYAALRGNTPENGRFVYFGFGFEGIDNAPDRNSSMNKVLRWLDAPPTSLAFWPSFASVTGGSSIALAGRLNGIGAGETIRVEQLDFDFGGGDGDEGEGDFGDEEKFSLKGPEMPGIWSQIGTAKTGTTGSWRLGVLPSKNSIYRAVWDGNGQKSRTISPMNFIGVSPLIKAWTTARGSIPAGGTTKIEGNIKPAPEDDMVTLFRRDQGEDEWDEVKSVDIGGGGRFSFSVNPAVNSFYRVGFEESDELSEGLSRQILVNTRHNLTLRAEDNLVPAGVKIYFGGKVYPAHPGHTIKLQRLENGKWKTMKAVKLGSGGNWSTSFVTNKEGRFKFRVIKERDAKHYWGSSNVVSVRFY